MQSTVFGKWSFKLMRPLAGLVKFLVTLLMEPIFIKLIHIFGD